MMAVAKLEYARADVSLRRPWYVWFGAAMASAWLGVFVAVTVWSIIGSLGAKGDSRPALGLYIAFQVIGCLIAAMSLVLEFRAMFRYSANAAAMVGLVLALVACVALFGEAHAVSRHGPVRDIAGMGAISVSLVLCAYTHFRWAALIVG